MRRYLKLVIGPFLVRPGAINAASVLLLVLASTSVAAAEYEDLGRVFLHAGWRCPTWSMEATGQTLQINDNQELYSMLGMSYGGDGRQTFGLPDMRDEVPVASNGRALRYCILTSLERETSAVADSAGSDNAPINTGPLPPRDAPRFANPTRASVGGATSTSLVVSWQDNSNIETGFVIQQLELMTAATGMNVGWTTVATDGTTPRQSDTGRRSHAIRNLRSGTNYCYRVRAYRGGDTTDATEMACARTLEVVN